MLLIVCVCEGVGQVSVYTWGSNSNLTLGHDHSRSYPEKLELPHNLIVNQVPMVDTTPPMRSCDLPLPPT